MNTKWFPRVTTLEELKKEYRRLAMEHHPDRGGRKQDMQEINREYEMLFDIVKFQHVNAQGEYYTKDTGEEKEWFTDIIDRLMRMEGLKIEVIGCFIWVGGNTRIYKDALKELGFRWHSKKYLWYKAPETYRKRSRKTYTIEEIEDMYGVQGEFTGRGCTAIA